MPTHPEPPPAPTENNFGAKHSQIGNLPAGYGYSHPYRAWAELFALDASAQDCQHDTDLDPDMLTNKRTSTS
jgi:hypothetical protein